MPTRAAFSAPASGNYTTSTSPKATATQIPFAIGDWVVVAASSEQAGTNANVTPSASSGTFSWSLVSSSMVGGTTQSGAKMWAGQCTAATTGGGATFSLARINTGTALLWGMSATKWTGVSSIVALFTTAPTSGTSSSIMQATSLSVMATSGIQCAGSDWNAVNVASRSYQTVNGAQMLESLYVQDAGNATAYGFYREDAGAAGTKTVGLTTPATLRWVMVGVEIRGATTTQVTATRSTSWRVRSPVASVRSTLWRVRSVVAPATRATTWRVRAAVAASRPTSYDVLSTVSTQRSTTWNVDGAKTQVTATRSTSWRVRQPVTAARPTTWRTTAAVATIRPTTWDVLRGVTADRTATWDTRTVVAASRSTTWDTAATITRALATSWDVRSQVTTQRSTTWNVDSTRISVTVSRATSWRTLAQPIASRPTSWDVRSLVSNTRTATWDVRTTVTRTRGTSWRTLAGPTTLRSTTWRTLERIHAARSTSWRVESDAATPVLAVGPPRPRRYATQPPTPRPAGAVAGPRPATTTASSGRPPRYTTGGTP